MDIPQGDHKAGFVMELYQGAYFWGHIVSSNHKNKPGNLKIKKRSPKEKHNVALSNLEEKKIKDAFEGENLSEEPDDGGFNLPGS